MKCEACGGDGLIEVGAYRGDEDDPNTRECRLCGGLVTLESRRLAQQVVDEPWEVASGSAGHAAQQLKQLAHASSKSGIRVRDLFLRATCSHDWDEQILSTSVQYKCKTCSDVVLVSRTDGSVIVGDNNRVTELDKLSLSSRVMTRHADYSLLPKTPADVAREYAQRLNEQNEREQRALAHVHAWLQGTDVDGLVRFSCMECPAWLSFTSSGLLAEYDGPIPPQNEIELLAAQIR